MSRGTIGKMSPGELVIWTRFQRRAASLSPDLAASILTAFRVIRDGLSDEQMARIIASGNIDALFAQALNAALIEAAFMPVRQQIRTSVGKAIAFAARDIPKPPGVSGSVSFAFDILNPRVIDGIRTLESKVIYGLASDVREVVRAHVENGLRDGVGPRTIARDIRGMIGLGKAQEVQVANFRAALQGRDGRDWQDYLRRDKRFDGTIAKALGKDGKGLTPEQVDKMTTAYANRRIALNAETTARTAALDAMKSGQHMAVADAVSKGVYDPNRLTKRWAGVMDSRERASHVEMQGDTVPWNSPFRNGQMLPGDSEFNCRCVAIYSQSRPAG